MKFKISLAIILFLYSIVCTAFGQGIPQSDWTPKEKEWVDSMRSNMQKRGLSFTDEQAALAVAKMREKIANFVGQAAALQSIGNIAPTTKNSQVPIGDAPPAIGMTTEEQLASLFSRLPSKTGDLVITPRRDGFDINGKPYLDSEGKIVNYAYDVVTGDITYLIGIDSRLVIKSMRAGSTSDPITIATATQSNGGWDVQTVTGKKLGGHSVSALPLGFLVSREYAAFRYEPGKGVMNIAPPSGYMLAPLQRGNVGATGYILLEKESADGGKNEVGRIISNLKAIGAMVGISRKEDYALMHMESGKLYPLNINADGKYQSEYSKCCKKKHTPAECRKMAYTENLFDIGGRNTQHYYWLVNWVNTPDGPIAISLENGHRDVIITDLTSGNKVVAFNRTLGFNWFDIEQKGDGKVRILTRAAFQTEAMEDAIAFMKSANKKEGKVLNESKSD